MMKQIKIYENEITGEGIMFIRVNKTYQLFTKEQMVENVKSSPMFKIIKVDDFHFNFVKNEYSEV